MSGHTEFKTGKEKDYLTCFTQARKGQSSPTIFRRAHSPSRVLLLFLLLPLRLFDVTTKHDHRLVCVAMAIPQHLTQSLQTSVALSSSCLLFFDGLVITISLLYNKKHEEYDF
jgi:hypothetical protein